MSSRPMRLTALATASALALATAPAAWSAPPPIPPRVDPPNRVARLARVNGAVSYHTADADRWSPASLNYPIRSGDAFWTEPGARADIQLAANRLALAPSTELDVASLDDHTLATSEPQGEAYLNLRQVPGGDNYAVQTPRGTVQITATGRYDVVAGDADHPTLVTVVDGAAQVSGPNLSLQIGPRQTATITGSDTLQGNVGPMAQDPFLTAMLAEEKPAPRATVPIPPFVMEMTGSEDLDTVGEWRETPDYGAVWYPPVDAGWVPYRHGHWAYVAPWGWTWVDDAPWGFAPFHYGRWAEVNNRWGWVPVTPGAAGGPVPVYAPALVNFVDLGGAALAGAAVGALAGRSVGWVPLGPREPYYPPYRANLPYVRSLNAPNIQNVNQAITRVTVVNNNTVVNNFVNRGATTIVPAAAMMRSAPIAAAVRPVPAQQLGQERALYRSPFAPGPTTAGVTPAVARQFNFVPPGRAAEPAPGPAIRPVAMPGARPALPPLRPLGVPAAAPPNEPVRPIEGVARPGIAPVQPDRPPEPLARPGAPSAEPGRPGIALPHPAGRAARPSEPPAAEARPPQPPRPMEAPRAVPQPAPPRPELHAPPAPRVEPAPPPRIEQPRPQATPRPPEAPRPPPPAMHAPPPVPHAAPPLRPAAPPPRPGRREEERRP